MPGPVRVLVVDDSAFMRKVVTDFINGDRRLSVIGTARNGRDALDKTVKLKPDVITLDIEMPEMNGIEFLKNLKSHNLAVPTVVLSNISKKAADITIEALAHGAVEVVPKPSGAISLDLYKVKEQLIETLAAAGKADQDERRGIATENPDAHAFSLPNKKLIVIGSSTGGPKALESIVPQLSAGLKAPVLIIQHMPKHFTASLAERLNRKSLLHVKEAEDGERLEAGVVYIAQGSKNMRVRQLHHELHIEIEDNYSQKIAPNLDLLLDSLTAIPELSVGAVVLTGMGQDGARGLEQLAKQCELYAIAESEETATIFGMPKAAIATGTVNRILPLEKIAAAVNALTEKRG